MNKLKLNVETLTVDSFPMAAAGFGEGTVQANEFAPTPAAAFCPPPSTKTTCAIDTPE